MSDEIAITIEECNAKESEKDVTIREQQTRIEQLEAELKNESEQKAVMINACREREDEIKSLSGHLEAALAERLALAEKIQQWDELLILHPEDAAIVQIKREIREQARSIVEQSKEVNKDGK